MTATEKLRKLVNDCGEAYNLFQAACVEEMEAEIKWGDPQMMEEASKKVEAAREKLHAARLALGEWSPEEGK